MAAPVILEVDELRTQFIGAAGIIPAVDGVSFQLREGDTIGIVGESGCGKSVTALSILRLIQEPHGRIAGGAVRFGGRDLLGLGEREMRRIRGNEISMIFQEPMTSLNPVLTIGRQIAETIVLHQRVGWSAARARALAMLQLVRIPEAERRLGQYPHELSGGMRQRVMIAMAVACDPKILIADEPTTALDVTIQAQILGLLGELKQRLGTAIILITHDLGVIAEMAQRVVVMYAGRKVEEAAVVDLFERPRHPYTIGLLRSMPRLSRHGGAAEQERLSEIPGMVPAPDAIGAGCAFAPRCGYAHARCALAPPLVETEPGHWSACWEAERLGALDHG